MFGVSKYHERLEKLRKERGVQQLLEHDLVAIEGNTVFFAKAVGADGVKWHFGLLHAIPNMATHEFSNSRWLADEAGFVDVDEGTLQRRRFVNIRASGDAADVPTSKTTRAITA